MNDTDKYWSFPVSLNINIRKQRCEEIFKANKKIAETLSKCKGSSELRHSKLKTDAEYNNRLKNMITKKNKLKKISQKIIMSSNKSQPKFTRMSDLVN